MGVYVTVVHGGDVERISHGGKRYIGLHGRAFYEGVDGYGWTSCSYSGTLLGEIREWAKEHKMFLSTDDPEINEQLKMEGIYKSPYEEGGTDSPLDFAD